jgi:hypothetical protein
MNENTPEELLRLQRAFAGHIRNPEEVAAPAGVENRRMKIYRDLFFNNIQSLISSNFPVLRTLFDNDRWQRLIRDFYSEHHCQTPLFPEVAKEFLRYLQDEREPRPDDPGFMHELAHYEWVELALSLDEREIADSDADLHGDLLTGVPVLSPLAWPLTYSWPVHRIRPDYQPSTPPAEATHILVYRNRADRVKFMVLNPVSRLLLEYLKDNDALSGLDLLNEVARTIRHPDAGRVVESGAELMEDLRKRGILLGARRNRGV